ncbi:peroxisomal membrane anchor protein conserved region-domain-containing protein [Aspergillus pseudonomiae]|uniref:Peroxisomal membrane protein PEX14 n=1 Tax=Aspergillus pseudonomiae TaxID=1506151 RepID=A0A5N7DDV8_9EURO|nr:peroxisomal membrane anchor protein conserved region-domain-containing protein [Aspergillus pseudonomiae]KAE8404646.1 peroxisomal membrane anchor protein conserved region-domain-containing protein [Aspergillus pseudonomiae]
MADSKPKPPSIPEWQRPSATNSASASSPSSDEASRSDLLQQATKFLEDESLRDAPLDRKVSFLESKGLRQDEIDSLLGVSRNSEATSSTAAIESDNKTTEISTTKDTPSDAASSSPSNSTSQSSSSPAATTIRNRQSSSARDVPPIITYPEFLVNQPKPPPLVSLRSLLYTVYGAAGLGATMYGASEYLVKSMIANLSSARHELAETAQDNLKKLNEKLEQNVSTIPPQLTARHTQTTGSNSDDETESVTSDPAELFHRDVAVQTTEDFSLENSSSSAANTADAESFDPSAAVNTHVKRLEVIKSHLQEFSETEKQSSTSDDTVRTSLNELNHYLDGLLYSKAGYGPGTGYGVYSTPGFDSSGNAAGLGKGEEDAISNFKAEIRGVKGALLSARNFPASRGPRISSGIGR